MPQARKQPAATKAGLVNLRMSPQDRAVIDQAARSAGKTRTEFMIEAARRAAQEALLDTTFVAVNGDTFTRFKAMLDAPPQPNTRLRELMSLKPAWER